MPIDTLNNIFPYLTYVVTGTVLLLGNLTIARAIQHYVLYEGKHGLKEMTKYILQERRLVFYRPNDIRKARTFQTG